MRRMGKFTSLGLGVLLTAGGVLALLLCVQCVRTYFYVERVLIPQEAEREAGQQVGSLASAVRAIGAEDAHALSPVLEQTLEASEEHVLWMRLLNQESEVVAQAGTPYSAAELPQGWWQRVERRESLGHIIDTPKGKAYATILPFRMPRGPRPEGRGPDSGPREQGPQGGRRSPAYALDLAIPLDSVTGAFSGLIQNLVVGIFGSLALLLSIAVIGLRTPIYLRGKYLERDLELARNVQNDLLPSTTPVSPYVDFAGSAVAAGQVGGDFFDIYETEAGKISIVLGDVSGKGMPAALLASVVQGAIRSSGASRHETACERINRMLCEKTASERFATLFWGVYDPLTGTLRYVNAGHTAPLLVRRRAQGRREVLSGGGPVLGLLPEAVYVPQTVRMETGDTLILYSDGISEAANEREEEFGDQRVLNIASAASDLPPSEICEQIMHQVADFADTSEAPDDRTLMVVRFLQARAAMTA